MADWVDKLRGWFIEALIGKRISVIANCEIRILENRVVSYQLTGAGQSLFVQVTFGGEGSEFLDAEGKTLLRFVGSVWDKRPGEKTILRIGPNDTFSGTVRDR